MWMCCGCDGLIGMHRGVEMQGSERGGTRCVHVG